MHVIILGIADDIRQADPVLRALDRCGLTVDDVMVLLACTDKPTSEQRPMVSVLLPAPNQLHADARVRPDAGCIAATTQARVCGGGSVAAWAFFPMQRPPTVTGNARIEPPLASAVAQDLHALGIPLPVARQIASVVRVDNLLLLIEEGPECSAGAIIDSMLHGDVSKVYMVTVADERNAWRQPDGSASMERAGAVRPPRTRHLNQWL